MRVLLLLRRHPPWLVARGILPGWWHVCMCRSDSISYIPVLLGLILVHMSSPLKTYFLLLFFVRCASAGAR